MHRKLSLTNDTDKFLDRLDAKQFKQVVRRILALAHEPTPTDSIQMKGRPYRRVDQGEYRIVYSFDEDIVTIVVVGKRNDDDVNIRAERWDTLLATEESQRLLENMADEAWAEIQAGLATPIVFTNDGEIGAG